MEKTGKTTVKTVIKTKKRVEVIENEPIIMNLEVAQDPIVANKKKILFVASEARPFIATGGLADVIGSLPQALAKDPQYDIRVVLPLYSGIKTEFRRKMSFLGNIYVPLSWRNQYCGVFTCIQDGVTFYFLDNEYYFKRPNCYGYYDDGERFAFFSRSVMEILPFINFIYSPQIL